jgi:hypothetical protein
VQSAFPLSFFDGKRQVLFQCIEEESASSVHTKSAKLTGNRKENEGNKDLNTNAENKDKSQGSRPAPGHP